MPHDVTTDARAKLLEAVSHEPSSMKRPWGSGEVWQDGMREGVVLIADGVTLARLLP